MTGEQAITFMYDPGVDGDVVERSLEVFEDLGFDVAARERSSGLMSGFHYLDVPHDQGWSVSIQVNEDDDLGADDSVLGLRLQHLVYPDRGQDGVSHEATMDVLFELVVRLAMALDLSYLAVFGMEQADGTVTPDGEPISESIDAPPRMGVYSSALLEALGGVDEFASDDPWYVAELTDGRTVVIRTAWPWGDGGWSPPTGAEYLTSATLDSDDTDAGDVTLGDPFAALAPGEYGADLVVSQADLDGEFRNEDAELVRVYVDENRDLRRVDDDSFVRNVVTETSGSDHETIGQMAANLPPGTDPEDVPMSVLLNEQVPPSFVHLDAPDGENVVTLVMGLNVQMSKYDVLMALANRARPDDGYTEEELQSIEGGLSTLVDVDDPLQVETWLRENVF